VNPIGYYFWLAGQAFAFPLIFPPAGLLMVGGLIGAVLSLPRVPHARWRQAQAAVLLPLAVPAAILLCGVLLAHDTALDTEAPRWPEWLVGGCWLPTCPWLRPWCAGFAARGGSPCPPRLRWRAIRVGRLS
jgi:hypothetical protein